MGLPSGTGGPLHGMANALPAGSDKILEFGIYRPVTSNGAQSDSCAAFGEAVLPSGGTFDCELRFEQTQKIRSSTHTVGLYVCGCCSAESGFVCRMRSPLFFIAGRCDFLLLGLSVRTVRPSS